MKTDQSVLKQRHIEENRWVKTWANRRLEEMREMVRQRQRQKAYKELGMMSEAMTSPFRFDRQHGQGSQSVLASHLHLLIKCHNNMIFNYQQVPPAPQKRAAAAS